MPSGRRRTQVRWTSQCANQLFEGKAAPKVFRCERSERKVGAVRRLVSRFPLGVGSGGGLGILQFAQTGVRAV